MSRALAIDHLSELGQALTHAAHGQRGDILAHYAAIMKISPSTLYRRLNRAGLVNGPERPREPTRPEYREWVVIAKQLALKVPKGRRPVPLWMAIRQAATDGLIPKEATLVHTSTLHRVARELGLQEQPVQTRQLWTKEPMLVCLIDASTSEHFSVIKRLDDGDYLLRLSMKPVSDGYKNKPLTRDRLRVVVYGLWEMYSGYQISRYTTALGENGEDAADFLLWACSDKNDDRLPFQGVMENLWSDQGPLFKNAATLDLLDRLDIDLVVGEAYEKARMGGVECSHKARWDWERHYYMRKQKDQHFQITLSQLNRDWLDYLAEIVNERDARFDPGTAGFSRREAWLRGVNRMGGVVKIPPDALDTLAITHRCKVRAGLFRFLYNDYEVDGMGAGEVYVITDTANVPKVVRNVDTGREHTFRYRGPVMVGEEFRGIADTPRDKLAKKAGEITGQNPIFGTVAELPANVIPIPARTLPAKPLANPLATELDYRTVDEAMAAFAAAYQMPMQPEERLMVRELLNQNRNKQYVADLAARLIHITATPALRIYK